MSAQNLTLLTDLYELTMMQGYFETQENQTVNPSTYFSVRTPNKGGYSIMAGVDQVIDYIKNLNFSYEDVDYLRGLGLFSEDFLHYLSGFHFSGDIYAIPEGSVIFPREPLIKVVAPIMEAQLVETAILTIINHQCPDRYQGIPRCIRRTGRWDHGIWSPPGTGTGCRTLRCKSCRHRWMRRYIQCTRRRDV